MLIGTQLKETKSLDGAGWLQRLTILLLLLFPLNDMFVGGFLAMSVDALWPLHLIQT